MYRVYFINFGYFAEGSFETLGAAIDHGIRCGFEFSAMRGNDVIAAWSPLQGLRGGL